MEFIEIANPSQMQQFSALLDRAFQLKKGMHYLDDFPIWSCVNPRVVRFGAIAASGELAGELVASAGVRQAMIQTWDGKIVPVALIGAVATDDRYRGQRLASGLVERALDWARERGAAVALLWGAEHSLYAKLGFALCGTQVLAPLGSLRASQEASDLSLQKGWNPRIFDLVLKRGDGVILTPEDRTWFEAHRNVDWYWLGPPSAPLAYAAVGRGIDLTGLVHEWGGEPAALLILLGLLRKQNAESELRLLSSPRRLVALGLSAGRQEYLFLANVLRPEAFLPADPRVAADSMGARCFGTPGHAGEIELWIWGLDAV
jgi:predicted N-acetyltransferase YhbS